VQWTHDTAVCKRVSLGLLHADYVPDDLGAHSLRIR
jgi:hypothetical protein